MAHRGHLLIDVNNIGFAATSMRVLKVGEQETQGVLGVLKSVRAMVATYPQLRPMLLWDGESWRKKEIEGYKANRDKTGELKPYEEQQQRIRASWKSQRRLVARGLKLCGVPQLSAANLEADDLVAMLVRRYVPTGAKVLMITGDKDWLQLVQPGCAWHDPIQKKRITAETFPDKVGYMKQKTTKQADGSKLVEDIEWRGCPNPKAYLEVKALMGDASDEIEGVGGIGDKGAIDLVRKFGSVQKFFEAVEIDKVDVPKKLADFCGSSDKKAIFYRNLRLMDLNHPDVPKPVRPKLIQPEFNVEAFTEFCEELLFNSITSDVDTFMEPFYALKSVSADLKEAA
jgi:5'-3' exonuclease